MPPSPGNSSTLVPFQCMVYTRSIAGSPYTYSHSCSSWVSKTVPASLRVQDLMSYTGKQNWGELQKVCFLVLVAGDTAQCVSLANLASNRTKFLYQGLRFSHPSEDTEQGPTKKLVSEFQEGHVPLHFYSTLSSFDCIGMLVDTTPVEC